MEAALPARPEPTAAAAPGLTSVEAARLLAEYGPNEPAPARRLSAVVELGRLFANPLVLILLAASAVSAWVGQNVDAGIIVTIVLLSVSVNFWQSYRSQHAAERLRASVAPTASVQRDGAWQELPLRLLVPGDLVRLSAGDLVPADARLRESRDLSVQQSMLTGESLPADKRAGAGNQPGVTGADAADRVFLGTSVVSGTATAVVTATGSRSLFGDIATRLASRAPETEFESGLRRFSVLILRTTMALVLFILLMGIVVRHDALESLLFAVALGVGLTPEFLPRLGGALAMLARDGVQEARVQLNPQELGPISVQITVDGTAAQVHLAVDSAVTRERLEQAMPNLAAALRENGLTLTGGGVFQQPRQAARDGTGDDQGNTGRGSGRESGAADAAQAVQSPPQRLRRVGALDLYA